MPEAFSLSQPAWALLDLLQEQLGVSVEVLDTTLRPLMPAGFGESAAAAEHAAVAGETAKSLRSGEIRIDRSTGRPIGIFPIRVARQVAGVLVISRRTTWPESAGLEVNIERAGHIVRTALETDISLNKQLVDARYRTRRAHGILRFLAQLGAMDAERELMNAVIQAATVWFDVDCRIYERHPDGSFAVAATLPGAEQRHAAARIDKGRAEKLIASRRFASGGDLEDLGLVGRKEEVLVLPVGAPAPDWLMILAGSIDQDVEVTFAAIAGVLAGKVQARERARIDTWQQRLASVIDENGRTPERVLLKLLEMLASDVDAKEARISLLCGESERILAALAPAVTPPEQEAASPPAPVHPEPDRHTATIEISQNTRVLITLTAGESHRLASLQLASWVHAIRPWLREAIAGLTTTPSVFDAAMEMTSFERRIQEEIERARRFNLGLGLVVIGGGATPRSLDPIVAAIRAELRASDLIGRIRGGQVAVLLVHSEPVGADSVVGRLRQRLGMLGAETSVTEVSVGKATFSNEVTSADALIAQALRQVQSLELRN